MIFYDCNGNEKHFDTLIPLSSEGCCSEVSFYSPDELLKIYHKTCHDNCKLKKYVYDVIKELKSSHMYEITSLLFDKKISGLYFDESHIFKMNPIDAYTCKYVKPDDINILTMSTDYILDNMYEISKIFSYLSLKEIRTQDVKPQNTILTSDKIILIDIDCFDRVDVSLDSLNRRNQFDIFRLLQNLFLDCIDKYASIDDDIKELIEYKQIIYKIFYELSSKGRKSISK